MRTQVLVGIMFLGFVILSRADRTVAFEETQERFANPERGFYHYGVLNKIDQLKPLEDLRKRYITLIYGKVEANEFRDKELTKEFLHKIDWGFYRARQAGLKVIFCMSYSDKIGDPDASLDMILRHIDQLKPIFRENADVIYLVKAGFIGPWGEWHSWQAGPDTLQNRRLILDRLLEAVPRDRMLVLRTPKYKLDLFDNKMLSEKEAFNGSSISRIGFHNDCFLSNDDDVGTYTPQKPRWAWIQYIGSETRFTPFGGETCRLHSIGQCANALDEMSDLHCSWLNWDYHPQVRDRWQKNGCLDEIERRLGYRFVVRNISIGEILQDDRNQSYFDVEIRLDNTGFASPFNSRLVELILRSEKKVLIQTLDEDPRFWLPGKPIVIQTKLKIPDEFLGRTCQLELRLPDPTPVLRDDPRYAIRLANTNVWDENTGTNVLVRGMEMPKPKIQITVKRR
ncbi:MAG: DUF4832 domain-containing protein [Planctomycetes bacterium]|nr:DUF4832 domain-containing protein [Planctomycetota bacterium]